MIKHETYTSWKFIFLPGPKGDILSSTLRIRVHLVLTGCLSPPRHDPQNSQVLGWILLTLIQGLWGSTSLPGVPVSKNQVPPWSRAVTSKSSTASESLEECFQMHAPPFLSTLHPDRDSKSSGMRWDLENQCFPNFCI